MSTSENLEHEPGPSSGWLWRAAIVAIVLASFGLVSVLALRAASSRTQAMGEQARAAAAEQRAKAMHEYAAIEAEAEAERAGLLSAASAAGATGSAPTAELVQLAELVASMLDDADAAGLERSRPLLDRLSQRLDARSDPAAGLAEANLRSALGRAYLKLRAWEPAKGHLAKAIALREARGVENDHELEMDRSNLRQAEAGGGGP